MRTSIAAAIVVAAVTALVNLSHDRVSAAELLKEVTRANDSYKGWLHIKITSEHPIPSMPVLMTVYFNTADGTEAQVGRHEGILHVKMSVPARKEQFWYDGKLNQVRIVALPDEVVERMRRIQPQAAAALIDSLIRAERSDALEVQRTRKDGLDRFEIRFKDPSQAGGFKGATIWVDPDTRLIRKIQLEIEEAGEVTYAYTYGPPAIKDIYDLGVPRDAKVIDERLKPKPAKPKGRALDIGTLDPRRFEGKKVEADEAEIRKLLDRLDGRAERGFGDGVAIMTRTRLRPPDAPQREDPGRLHVFICDGDSRWLNVYQVGHYPAVNGWPNGVPAIDRLKDWPEPRIDEVLPHVGEARPLCFCEKSGGQTRRWFYDTRKDRYVETDNPKGRLWGLPRQVHFDLDAYLWPTRERLELRKAGAKIELREADDRPGQIGLLVDVRYSESESPHTARKTMIHWIDPARGDVPVETLWISHKRKPAGPPTRQYWRYTEHQQLPDGRWYPTKWQAHALAIANTGKGRWANQSYIMDDAEFRLRVYPGMKVDNSKLAKPSMSR